MGILRKRKGERNRKGKKTIFLFLETVDRFSKELGNRLLQKPAQVLNIRQATHFQKFKAPTHLFTVITTHN